MNAGRGQCDDELLLKLYTLLVRVCHCRGGRLQEKSLNVKHLARFKANRSTRPITGVCNSNLIPLGAGSLHVHAYLGHLSGASRRP